MEQSWNTTWDDVFASREWGKYPDLEVVRFVARNFYGHKTRSTVKLLEVGCGTGANVWYMTREGFDVTGIDGSGEALQILRRRLDAEGLKAEICKGDITSLPFAPQSFDAVIDCECIYSNSKAHTVTILDEIRRVLKPEGLFLSLCFSPNTWGFGCGIALEEEKNTFLQVSEGPLSNTGLARFTDENDVNTLYGSRFELKSLETIRRSCNERTKCVEEWVVICAQRA